MSNSSNSLVPPQTLQDAFQDLEAGALSLSDYQELITSLEFQEMVEEWLTKIKSTTSTPCDITSRMLCVCPMIAYHLSDMVSDPTRKPHQKIYSQALHTIDVWDKFTGDNSITLEKLLQAFHNFSRHFRVWKKVDSFQVVEEYAKLYWELEVQKAAVVNFTESTTEATTDTPPDITLTETQQTQIREMTERQEKIREAIEQSVGPEGLLQLEQYTPVMMNDTALANLQEEVTTTIQKSYWDSFRQSIELGDWSFFNKLLEEICHRFQAMIPNRADVREELVQRLSPPEESTSPDYRPSITQAAEWSSYMVEMMEHFQSPAATKDRETFWESIQDTPPFNTTSSNVEWSATEAAKFFTTLFQWVMSRQDDVFRQIHYYQQQKKASPQSQNPPSVI